MNSSGYIYCSERDSIKLLIDSGLDILKIIGKIPNKISFKIKSLGNREFFIEEDKVRYLHNENIKNWEKLTGLKGDKMPQSLHLTFDDGSIIPEHFVAVYDCKYLKYDTHCKTKSKTIDNNVKGYIQGNAENNLDNLPCYTDCRDYKRYLGQKSFCSVKILKEKLEYIVISPSGIIIRKEPFYDSQNRVKGPSVNTRIIVTDKITDEKTGITMLKLENDQGYLPEMVKEDNENIYRKWVIDI